MNRPRILTLEEALEYINDDELVEVTPQSIRLRKKILNKAAREKEAKRKTNDARSIKLIKDATSNLD